MKKNKIILIGFMGCGKSTIAKALAKRLDYKLIDTDALIEQRLGLSVKEIFAQRGEAFFRAQEKALASELKELKNAVIATGGGFYEALSADESALVVYLKASFNYIRARLNKAGLEKRPLFKDEKAARELYKSRLKGYESKANLIVLVEHKSVLELINLIMKGRL